MQGWRDEKLLVRRPKKRNPASRSSTEDNALNSFFVPYKKTLLKAFWRLKKGYGRQEWSDILSGDRAHELVSSMDDVMAAEGVFTPFWSWQLEMRLPKPEESSLYSDDFLPKHTSRGERAARQPHKFPYLFEIKKTKNSQLFFLLRRISEAQTERNETCAALCPNNTEWLVCDKRLDRCVATVNEGGSCLHLKKGACRNSECSRGICKARDSSKDIHKNLHAKKIQYEEPTTTVSIPETTEEIFEASGEEPATEITLSAEPEENAERRRKFRTLDGAPDPEFKPLLMKTIRKTAEKPQLVALPPVPSMKDLPDPYVKPKNQPFYGEELTKIPAEHEGPLLTSELLPKGTLRFADSAPFPTVYFTVTVIEGEYRKRKRRQRFASGYTVYTTGANMPNGYTHKFEGHVVNGTTVLRVLDPQGGLLTEFNVTVLDKQGRTCQQVCKYGIRTSYRQCLTDIVRLSSYPQYSDPITVYPTPNEALQSAWRGQGYFRERKPDYLVFKCPNERRHRKRHSKTGRFHVSV
ncbi:unnamed protein product, partial [Mesorhabditis spiculigera]